MNKQLSKNLTMANRDSLNLGMYLGHDTGVALVDGDGQPIQILEESKFCGYKSPYFHPASTLSYFRSLGISKVRSLSWSMEESTQEGCYHEKFYSFVGNIVKPLRRYLKSFFTWEHEYFLSHHESHAESVLWPSPFIRALVVIIDGSGEDESLTLFLGNKESDQPLIKVCSLPTRQFSFGNFYGKITSYLGYRYGRAADHCGKIMGLSSYGAPRYTDFFVNELHPNGELFPEMNAEINGKIIGEFGYPFKKPNENYSSMQADVAASVQSFIENEILRLLTKWRNDHPEYPNLCLAGGVAMNSLLNRKILQSRLFDDLFVQPVSSDTGLAFGCAHYGARRSSRRPKFPTNCPWKTAYFGYQHDNIRAEITDITSVYCLPITIKNTHVTPGDIADLLSAGRILGLFQGAQEVGARALGNRSILCLPTTEHRDTVNRKAKFREPWRPFAPVVRVDDAEHIFGSSRPEPFMTTIYDVMPKYREALSGITHVDGTARLQTVSETQNPFLYAILGELQNRHIEPVLINTSFNINGQAIVRTAYDAIITYLYSGIDDLIVENHHMLKDTDQRLPASKISCYDRMLEPLLRNVKEADILLSGPKRELVQDLQDFMELPCISLRANNQRLRFSNLYYNGRSINILWDLLAGYTGTFTRIKSQIPDNFVDTGRCLIVLTGDQPVLDYLDTDTGHYTVPTFSDVGLFNLIERRSRSGPVILIDHYRHVVTGDYYFNVVSRRDDRAISAPPPLDLVTP